MRVCVIGAGASGLVCIKELREQGHNVICYELGSGIGGAFKYFDKEDPGAKAYDSTLLTVSNYFMAFSSFLPSSEPRKYWTASEYLDYLHRFAEHFGLLDCITFNARVVNVIRVKPDDSRPRADCPPWDWRFDVMIQSVGGSTTQQFDAVAVCSGTHQTPRIPHVRGAERFMGDVRHSSTYQNAKPFNGKRVLCVGIGESSADITHEIAREAEETHLMIRHYPSVVPRYEGKHTNDTLTSRVMHSTPKRYGNALLEQYSRGALENFTDMCPVERLVHEWTVKCGGLFDQFLTKNEIFLQSVAEEKINVIVTDAIESFEEDKVIFSNGTAVEIDTVMWNTGYRDDFSFLSLDVEISDVRTSLFKHMIHPALRESFCFLGFARPGEGGVPPCSEMQARYWSLLLSDTCHLPDEVELRQRIQHDVAVEEERFSNSRHIKSLVKYSGYMDSMARLIECDLPVSTYLFHPFLGFRLFCGSQISAQYRLRGPGASPAEARSVIQKLDVGWSWSELFDWAKIWLRATVAHYSGYRRWDLTYS